ncbi:DNA-binding protein, partial [Streptomyces sp. SCA2-4]|nr:DNA-binding protein [Streptomyces huiliensis]
MAGETTLSFLSRIAVRYGMDSKAVLSHWQWHNHPPRHDSGALRADAEVLLDTAGRRVLTELCGAGEETLKRALPSWGREDAKLAGREGGAARGVWRVGGAVV